MDLGKLCWYLVTVTNYPDQPIDHTYYTHDHPINFEDNPYDQLDNPDDHFDHLDIYPDILCNHLKKFKDTPEHTYTHPNQLDDHPNIPKDNPESFPISSCHNNNDKFDLTSKTAKV